MDEMIVPPTPQWFKTNIFVCTPDNTLIYGSKNDIIVMKRQPGGPTEIRSIPGAHSRFILTVGVNKKWNDPNQYVVSVAEDNVIRIWDMKSYTKKCSNNVFGEQKRTAVGAVFAGDDRIVSVTENGIVLIWNIVKNETKMHSDLLKIGNKTQVTCLSSCPHAGHLAAFGFSDGAIIVADLRRDGYIMHKLRGHDRSVTTLSWCPAPINVFPKRPFNTVGLKKVPEHAPPVIETDAKPEWFAENIELHGSPDGSLAPIDGYPKSLKDVPVIETDSEPEWIFEKIVESPDGSPASIDGFPKRPFNTVGLKKVSEDAPPVIETDAKPEWVFERIIEPHGSPDEIKIKPVDETRAESVEDQQEIKVESENELLRPDKSESVESCEYTSYTVTGCTVTEFAEFVDKFAGKEPVDEKHESMVPEKPESIEKSGSDTKLASSTDEPESGGLEGQKHGAIKKTERRSMLKAKKKRPRKRPDASGDAPLAAAVEVNDFLAECNNLRNEIMGIARVSRAKIAEHPVEKDEEEKVDLPENPNKDDGEGENEPHLWQNREMPHIFDHSCDFFDNVAEDPKPFVSNLASVKQLKSLKRDEPKEKVEAKIEPERQVVEDQSKEKSADVEPKEKSVEDKPEEKSVEDKAKEKSLENKPKEKNVEDEPKEKSAGEESGEKSAAEQSEYRNAEDESKEKGVEGESEEKSVEVGSEKNEDRKESDPKKRQKTPRKNKRKTTPDTPPKLPNGREVEVPVTEYLLASAGRDKRVYIWRAGTDGRMQDFFSVPRRSTRSEPYAPWNFVAISWATPTELLVTTLFGEIFVAEVPRIASSHFVSIHKKHTNCTVFNMVTPMKYYNSENWKEKAKWQIWSHDQKSIVYYDTAEKEPVCFDMHTITANITCFASSPLDPNRVAIGFRDCFVHTWDLSKTRREKNKMPKFSRKLKGKVTTLAWHPTKETVLGFGTDEGAVGTIENSKPTEHRDISKTSTLHSYFRSEVYKVEWGPITGNKTYLGLYAVAEGKLVIYDVCQSKKTDPIIVEMPDKNMYLNKFAWKPDYSCLLLSMKDGRMVVLNTDLQIVSTIYLDDKAFNHIAWHPEAAESDAKEFKFCNWIAAATTKGVILYDTSLTLQKDATNEQLLESKRGVLDKHLKPVSGMAWSPFKSELLVTTSSDGLIHVWDVLTRVVISTYIDEFFSHITAVMWSPSNPDLVIIGEKQVVIWDIKKHPAKVDTDTLDNVEDDVTEFMAEHKKAMLKAAPYKSEVTHKEPTPPKIVVLSGENQTEVEIPKTIKLSKKTIVPTIYTASDDNIELQIANMRKLMNDESFGEEDPLNLFGSQTNVLDLLMANREHHKKDFKNLYSDLIALFKGDVATCVKEAIQDNRVTPFIISLAPMVSTKLWQEACESYAKTLSEEASPNFLQAAGYYLMCNKIEEAVNCLCEGSLYREALALAKCRFPKDSPIVFNVTEKWAKDCFNQGNYELTAYCSISIGQFDEAARALAKRNKPEMLQFALELATKAENSELSAMIVSKLNDIQNSIIELTKSSRLEAMLAKDAEHAAGITDSAEQTHSNSITTASCDDVKESSDEKDLHSIPEKEPTDVSVDAESESPGDSLTSPSTCPVTVIAVTEAPPSSEVDEKSENTSTKDSEID